MVAGVKGTIVIRRISELFFSLEPLDIYIDGRAVDKILAGDTKEFKVEPGRHRIRAGTDIVLYGSFNSNDVDLEIGPGESVTLECGSIYQGVRVLLSKFCLLHKDSTFYIKKADAC